MKKTVTLILAIILVLSLCACGQTAAPAPEAAPEVTPEPTTEPTPEPTPSYTSDDFVGVYIGDAGTGICLNADGSAVYYAVIDSNTDSDCKWNYDSAEAIITVTLAKSGYELYAYTDDGPSSLLVKSKDRAWTDETFIKQVLPSSELSYKDYVRLINVMVNLDNSKCHEFSFEGMTFQVPDYYTEGSDVKDGTVYFYSDSTKGGAAYAKLSFTSIENANWAAVDDWNARLDEFEKDENNCYRLINDDYTQYITECTRIDRDGAPYVYVLLDYPNNYGDNLIYADALLYSPASSNLFYARLECYEAFYEDYYDSFIEMLETSK